VILNVTSAAKLRLDAIAIAEARMPIAVTRTKRGAESGIAVENR